MIKAAIFRATGYTGDKLVRLLPPLTIYNDELEEGFEIIKNILDNKL